MRDEPRDAPDGGASSDWMGGMSGLSLRFQKDMPDSVNGWEGFKLYREERRLLCIYYIT